MEIIASLIDFIVHVDKHLEFFVQNYGLWVYALLFAIVFVETGLVVMPFLPGDSLLFIVGAMGGAGLLNLPLARFSNAPLENATIVLASSGVCSTTASNMTAPIPPGR